MRDSRPLYDAVAADLDATFDSVPHRSVYDQLAWEIVERLLPSRPGVVIDAGCGSGRWVNRLLDLGHRVIGIERSSGMVSELLRRRFRDRFHGVYGDLETLDLAPDTADVTLAMGSLQYVRDPAAMVRKLVKWTKRGGWACVLVDSYLALVTDLVRRGQIVEAIERAESGFGVWRSCGHEADLHLLDSSTLRGRLEAASLEEVRCYGLLVSATAWGRTRLARAIRQDREAVVRFERRLASCERLADGGKHILACGRKP